MRFTFVAAAYHPSTPRSSGFAHRVPRNAGELFTKPSLWRVFARSSILGSKSNGPLSIRFSLFPWGFFIVFYPPARMGRGFSFK
ncbi:MAG: hypothetical protein NTY64_17875 [Deltaproteobacteria bacterium]|nr:hypothetical protein [Deltaproteobacteria bacterium]